MSPQIPFLEAETYLSEASEALSRFLPDGCGSMNQDLLSAAVLSLDNARFELGVTGFEYDDDYAKKIYSEVDELVSGLSDSNTERTSFELDKIIFSKDFQSRIMSENKMVLEINDGIKINL